MSKKKYLKLLESSDKDLTDNSTFEIGQEDSLHPLPHQKSWIRENIKKAWDHPGITGDVYGPNHQERSYKGVGPKGYKRSDERIYEEVCEELLKNSQIDASDIVVHVEDGVVFLSGKVSDRKMKKMTENLVEEIFGVQDVRNSLVILKHHQLLKGSESVLGKDLGIT
jgi:hypothetical protein